MSKLNINCALSSEVTDMEEEEAPAAAETTEVMTVEAEREECLQEMVVTTLTMTADTSTNRTDVEEKEEDEADKITEEEEEEAEMEGGEEENGEEEETRAKKLLGPWESEVRTFKTQHKRPKVKRSAQLEPKKNQIK